MPLYEYKTKTGGLISVRTTKPLTEKEQKDIERSIGEPKDATVDECNSTQQRSL